MAIISRAYSSLPTLMPTCLQRKMFPLTRYQNNRLNSVLAYESSRSIIKRHIYAPIQMTTITLDAAIEALFLAALLPFMLLLARRAVPRELEHIWSNIKLFGAGVLVLPVSFIIPSSLRFFKTNNEWFAYTPPQEVV